MNYKKVITAILLVSDGSVNHKYFLENLYETDFFILSRIII